MFASTIPLRSARRGFSLIELMIVIAIILVLVGLLSAAVGKAIISGQQARNRNDIMQLEMAVQAFKTQYGFYPPSRLLLCEQLSDYAAVVAAQPPALQAAWNQLANDSQFYLNTMFPRLVWGAPLSGAPSGGLDWDSSGGYTPPSANNNFMVLFGDQCLVWFLGGPGGLNGFSTNPGVPTQSGGTRTPTFYEFQTGRLKVLHGGSPFPSYVDTYGKDAPFLYFSSYKNANGYNRYSTMNPNMGSDCQFGTTNVWQYGQAQFAGGVVQLDNTGRFVWSGQYFRPNSFQIVSAGRNGVFAMTGSAPRPPQPLSPPWLHIPGDRTSNASIVDTVAGKSGPSDDQTNFNAGLISSGQ